jgi:hypothetical protein
MVLDVHAGRGGAALCSVPHPPPLVAVPATPLAAISAGQAPPMTRTIVALGVMASIGAGLYAGTLLVTVGLLVLVLGLASVRAARGAFRHGLDAHFERRRRAERRRIRERRLDELGVSHDALAELTILGDEIERRDPELHARFEVDEMLDRHVELTLAHERCLRAMRMADRDQLARAKLEHLNRPGGSRRRADMFERRLRYWDQCKAQADRCDEELAVMGDMIRLLAQKAICPSSLIEDDLVERRLGELDDEEVALHQLSLLDHG